MKNQLKFLTLAIFLIGIMSFTANAEMVSYSSVNIHEDTNSVSHHSYYQYYDDIEELSRGGQLFVDLKRSLLAGRTNNVIVWAIIEAMPNVQPEYTINYCEFNISRIITTYDNDGNLIGSNQTSLGFTYSTGGVNDTYLYFELKNRDSLVTDVQCYYNSTNDSLLYDDNVLFGRSGIYIPANKCNDCTEFTLEELSNEIARTDELIQEETIMYRIIQRIVDYNYQLWLIASWLIKLLLVLAGIFLVFYALYYLYFFLKDVEKHI
jgi:hypothetical protein